MSRIKTRENVKSIKSLDKAAIASERMRQTAIRAKEKTSALVDNTSNSSGEYAQDKLQYGMEDMSREAVHGVVKGAKSTVQRGKKYAMDSAKKRSVQSRQTQADQMKQDVPQGRIRVPDKTIKQSQRSSGSSTIKTAPKTELPVSASREIKTAQQTSKVSVKTADATAKAASKVAKESQQTVQRIRAAAKKAKETAKKAADAVAASMKAIIRGVKTLVAAIASGGTVAILAVVIIMLIALLVGSCFGIFFSSEEKNDGSDRMFHVVREINTEFDKRIEGIKNSVSYDELILSGSHAQWQDILAIYAVKTTNDTNDPVEVASVTDVKKGKLRDVFWDMTEIDSRTESVTTGEGDDAVTTVYLYITVTSKTVDEMAAEYGFSDEQMELLHALRDPQYDSIWRAVIGSEESQQTDRSDQPPAHSVSAM